MLLHRAGVRLRVLRLDLARDRPSGSAFQPNVPQLLKHAQCIHPLATPQFAYWRGVERANPFPIGSHVTYPSHVSLMLIARALVMASPRAMSRQDS